MMKYIKSIVKEIVPVIIGILIALFINNWNEDRKERKYFNEILNSIELELEETKEDIKSTIIIQKSLIDTLEFYAEDGITSLEKIMYKTNGITLPTIRIHSWKALSNSRIELLNYSDLSDLANIEEDKDVFIEKSKYMMNFLYNNIGKKDREKKIILRGLMLDIMGTENSILSYINDLTQRINARD